MNTKNIVLTLGLGALCLVLVSISYKLFEYHRQLRELISIVQQDSSAGSFEQNVVIPTVTEKLIGKSQLWRPVQAYLQGRPVQDFQDEQKRKAPPYDLCRHV